MILLCELCSESYDDVFTKFVNTEEEAKNAIVDFFASEDAKYKFEDKRCTVDIFDDEERWNEWHTWYVFQWFEVTGNFIVLHHHAFDGVDFDIVGEFDSFVKARDTMVMKAFDCYTDCPDDQRELQWISHNSACIDTGNEWEHWIIVEAPAEVKK